MRELCIHHTLVDSIISIYNMLNVITNEYILVRKCEISCDLLYNISNNKFKGTFLFNA